MAKVKQLEYWSEFLLLRQKKVSLASSMIFLLDKYLRTNKADRFRQGKKDGTAKQSCHIKMVIFTTALPGGNSNGGTSNNLGTNANFWSATENDASNSWNRNLNTGNAQANRNNNNKTNGFSVRCLQNWHKPVSVCFVFFGMFSGTGF